MESGPLVPANRAVVQEMQPSPSPETARPPLLYASLGSQESGLGEYVRVLMKRKWTVLACLVTIVGVVAIASLRTTKVYEAGGSIVVRKPESGLMNFKDSGSLGMDYYDPTELDTEVKVIQSDLLALEVIK